MTGWQERAEKAEAELAETRDAMKRAYGLIGRYLKGTKSNAPEPPKDPEKQKPGWYACCGKRAFYGKPCSNCGELPRHVGRMTKALERELALEREALVDNP